MTLLTVVAVWCLPLQLFLAQFMNTGLVTLLVNAHLPNIAVKIGSTGLFLVRVCGLCYSKIGLHTCILISQPFCTACCIVCLSQGQFNDFDARYAAAARCHLADSSSNLLSIRPHTHHSWYSVVGVSLVLTMMLNTLGPQAAPLAKWLCLMPCKRWWGRRNALIQVRAALLVV